MSYNDKWLPYQVGDIILLGIGDKIIAGVPSKYQISNRGFSNEPRTKIITIGDVYANAGKIELDAAIRGIKSSIVLWTGYEDITDKAIADFLEGNIPKLDNSFFDTSIYTGEWIICVCEWDTAHESEMGHNYSYNYIKCAARKYGAEIGDEVISIQPDQDGLYRAPIEHKTIRLTTKEWK